MSVTTHNELLQSYNFSQDLCRLKDEITSVCNEREDLVFICNKEQVGVSFGTVISIFPLLKEVLRGFSSDIFTLKNAKIYVSLDNSVDPDMLKNLFKCFSENKEFLMSHRILQEVKDLLLMFGSNLKHFNVVKVKSADDGLGRGSKEGDTNDEPSEQEQRKTVQNFLDDLAARPVVKKPNKGTPVAQPTANFKDLTSHKVESEEKQVAKPGQSKRVGGGTKRKKNIHEAVENIAKKRIMEAGKPSNDEKQVEDQVTISEETPKISAPKDDVKKANRMKLEIRRSLPHLQITTVGGVTPPELAEVASPAPVFSPLKEVEVDSAQKGGVDVKCPEAGCMSKSLYKTRMDLLQHLVQVHYSELFTSRYPFTKDQACPLCPANKTKKTISKDKQNWVKHILTHETMLEIFPEELKTLINSIPKRQRTNTKKLVTSGPDSVTLDETPAESAQTAVESLPNPPPDSQESGVLTDSTEAVMMEKTFCPMEPLNVFGKPLATSTLNNSEDKTERLERAVDDGKGGQTEERIKCEFCSVREFSKLTDYLFHLSVFHFKDELMEKFPFKEGEKCSMCDLTNQTPVSSHLQHVGVHHQQILSCLPPRQDTGPPQPPSVECLECKENNKVKTFQKRSEFLKHLSLGHYGKQLLQKYPFEEGKDCEFCLLAPVRREFRATKKEFHVCHIGVSHGKLYDFLTEETRKQISQLPPSKKNIPNQVNETKNGITEEATSQSGK